MDTHTSTVSPTSDIFKSAAQIEWTPGRETPEGLCVESMRHRGIDRLTIKFGSDNNKASLISKIFAFGKYKNRTCVRTSVSIADDQLCLEQGARESAISISDIRAIEVIEPSRSQEASLRIETCRAMVRCGNGLPIESLQWLRDQLVLEVAGLAWRPIFNVGRRTTIKTVSADFDTYKNWPEGNHPLLRGFIEQAPDQAKNLITAIKDEHREIARNHAAWLKAACASVGALYLSGLCQRIEVNSDNEEFDDIDILVQTVELEFNSLVRHLCSVTGTQIDESNLLDEKQFDTEVSEAPKAAKVLLVEDSIVNQEIATALLANAGHHTTIASDGREALEILDTEEFDLILMDCQMPGMDGIEATKRIRKIQNIRMSGRTPIIALTANALKDDKKRCMDAQMDDYLAKPYAPKDFIAKVNKWLDPKNHFNIEDTLNRESDAEDETDIDVSQQAETGDSATEATVSEPANSLDEEQEISAEMSHDELKEAV